MKKLSKELVKSLIYEALAEDGRGSPRGKKLSKERIKEIIQEEISLFYGAK